MTTTIFTNGVFFQGSDLADPARSYHNAMVVKGSKIVHVGSHADEVIRTAKQSGADTVDLAGRIVVPGFIDAHVHILFFGLSLLKLDLEPCQSLEEIRAAISRHAEEHPELPRILCRGWQQFTTKGAALASTLDDLDPRPIFVEALDLHSSWCNTAALNELPLDEIKAICPEYLPCDEAGKPTGLVMETAVVEFVWGHLLKQCIPGDLQAALGRSFDTYLKAGYTGIIDMAMDNQLWEALQTYRRERGLPLHVAAHWMIPYSVDPQKRRERLEEALDMHRQWHPSKVKDFCIVGIKLINDGVVDGCTAALSRPYGKKAQLVHPMWPHEEMEEIVKAAAAAGMQCAIHSIGDGAVKQAVDCIASANSPQGRHRIEHLEITSAEDAKRLGQLGITASVQPIHSDPARLIDYAKLVGPEAWSRAFAYREFLDGNACVAIGSDAPTAPHFPFHNLYTATTRKSASNQDFSGQVNPSGALTLAHAMTAATSGAAYSRFAESWVGSLRAGLQADFLVLDTTWEPEKLLHAKVWQTWSRGKKLYQA
ncbi:amidohydrolase family protein [Paramyrothecium foliicola]|nr:amidohydrolase family protein [Paramyrothecium foliicola]